MNVIKPNRLSCLTRPYKYLNKDYLAVTAYAMVDFSSGLYLDTEQRLWGTFKDESVLNFGTEALDFGIPKHTPEIILNAHGFGVYAVNGRTAVSVSVNNVRKDLWVTGDRYWSDGKPTQAIPFESIPINWRNAYGGAGYEDNPVGKGHHDTELNGLSVRFLPNIEDPAHPVIHPGKRYAPAGYAAIPIETPGRHLMLGTYDDHWRVHEFPGFARDIDWEYFNQSPPRQRLNRLETGDQIAFTHMHRDKEKLITTVPPLVVRAFIKMAEVVAQESGFLREVPLKLTTYWAYPHLEKAILIYQGAVLIGEDDASDVSHILYAAEHTDLARPQAYYEKEFHERLNPQTAAFSALLDKALVDTRFIRVTSDDEIELSPLLQNKFRKLEKELAQNTLRAEAGSTKSEETAEVERELAWLKKSRNGKISRDEVIEDILKQQRQGKMSLKEAKQQFRKRRQASKPSTEEPSKKTADERQRYLREHREALLVSLKEDAEKSISPGESPQTAASPAAQDQLRQLRLLQLEQFEDSSSRALTTTPPKRDWSGRPRKLYRIFGLNQLITDPLPAGDDGYELHGFVATEASYAGWSLNGLTITESRVSRCNFSKSQMARCDFYQVVFHGCDFSSVDWNQAIFKQCQFIDCRLPDVQSDKAQFEDCRFVQSDLTAWMHFKISLKNCIFEQCRFVNFAYTRSRLENITFEKCHFLRHGFLKGRIKGLRMDACHIDSMSFAGITAIQGFHLSQCQASKLYFAADTMLQDLDISHSTVSASSFRKVDFNQATIMASDLSTCDFSEAKMQETSIADSFFKRCLFVRSDLSKAHINNSDFSEAQMKSADFTCTDMRHVSFFSAELAMIKADANTIQQDMLMDRSNVYPLRK
ncbi:DUF2169 domain-containing protein [Bordetella tumulicola]|uniref:DUF2169 family type VI secretion system accessory protein n=1 Tax=Bordetella tumulicola TaxID=1649133 RepID=UPI0039F126CA